jgi:hypothetical protein
LKGDLKEVMKTRRDTYSKEVKKKQKKEVFLKETESGWWDQWMDFKEDLKRIVG